MTSSIKVTAHVSADKQVRVKHGNNPDYILQHGESIELWFSDDVIVSANEEVKQSTVQADAAVSIGGDGPVKP